MSSNEFVENGKVKYNDLERSYLLKTHPSYLGEKSSDLENLVTMKSFLTTFDFTLVKPDANVVDFLQKQKQIWEKYGFEGSLSGGNFENAYELKDFVQKQFDVIGDRVFPDSKIKYVRNQNDEKFEENSEFLYAKSRMLEISPQDAKIFFYGSGMENNGKQNDFDFRSIVPKIDSKTYVDYINFANELKDEKMPITFGILSEKYFKNFQLSDILRIFEEGNSFLIQGEMPIYESKGQDKLGLIGAGQKLIKTRESLVDNDYFSIPSKVKARRNEAYFVNKIFDSIFGNKNLEFQKFSEEELYPLEIKNALVKANEKLRVVFDAYSNEILKAF